MVWRENGAGNEATVVSWYGGLVDERTRMMGWAIIVHEAVAGVWPAVASLISVNHLNRFNCLRSEE